MPGICWNDPVTEQQACEPWIWTPSTINDLWQRTGANFRTIHARVMACHPWLSADEKAAWSALYKRWMAFSESEPSLYTSATPTTIHGYVTDLQSWVQLLKGRGCWSGLPSRPPDGGTRSGIDLEPTKQPEDDDVFGDPFGSLAEVLKWAAIAALVGGGLYFGGKHLGHIR
jgi:hypothetical protein